MQLDVTDALEEYKRYSELIARFIKDLYDNGNFKLLVLNDVMLKVGPFCSTVDYRLANVRHEPRDINHSSRIISNNHTVKPTDISLRRL